MNKSINLIGWQSIPGVVITAFVLFLIVATLLAATFPIDLEAAEKTEESQPTHTWVGFGCGPSSLGSPGGHLNISRTRGHIIFGIRSTASSGGKYEVVDRVNDYDTMGDLALLVGLTRRCERLIMSASTGVAGVGGTFHEKDPTNSDILIKRDYQMVLGLPFEAQLIWRLGDNAGLGLYGYANVNSNRNHGGVCISLIFGKI
ncbi:MAG: hypothetical protein KOO63_15660 [Bacteroidales bacterium]|nr:hypothetical protein [Candidatus Latescibacterota bacterium]